MLTRSLQILAAVASFVAFSSMSTACWYIFHQPEVPEALRSNK